MKTLIQSKAPYVLTFSHGTLEGKTLNELRSYAHKHLGCPWFIYETVNGDGKRLRMFRRDGKIFDAGPLANRARLPDQRPHQPIKPVGKIQKTSKPKRGLGPPI